MKMSRSYIVRYAPSRRETHGSPFTLLDLDGSNHDPHGDRAGVLGARAFARCTIQASTLKSARTVTDMASRACKRRRGATCRSAELLSMASCFGTKHGFNLPRAGRIEMRVSHVLIDTRK